MRALFLDGEARVREDQPEPQRAAGEALIATRLVGICDTDLQLAQGYMGFAGIPGHEFVGSVLEADSPRWVGKRVVANINAGCGECPNCVDANGHHCASRTVLGIVGRGGALAERFTLPERCLVEVPDDLDDERAVFAEPLAAALHVLDVPSVADAQRVVVIGDGKLGLLIAAALCAAVDDVVVIGRHEHKLALARGYGARGLLESALEREPIRAPVVIDAAGGSSGLDRALAICEPNGTVVLKTTIAGKPELDLSAVVINELRVVGSRCGSLQRAVATLHARRVDPLPLIEARYGLGQADAALAHAARRGVLKVLVDAAG